VVSHASNPHSEKLFYFVPVLYADVIKVESQLEKLDSFVHYDVLVTVQTNIIFRFYKRINSRYT
jgi:hypothetical protein